MPYFVVERHLPGITVDGLKAAGLRAKTCSTEMTLEGTEVRWLRSFFTPDNELCCCYFEAPDRESVVEVNRRANIPLKSISEVLQLEPQAV